MKRFFALLVLLLCLPVQAYALELEAPPVPRSGAQWMPESTASFSDGLRELLTKAVSALRPELSGGAHTVVTVIGAALLLSLADLFSQTGKQACQIIGAAAIGSLLIRNADAMIRLAGETLTELADYGKLLLPVMSAALAAQGGISASAGLYLGTAFFSALLGNLLSGLFVPLIYLFLALAIGFAAFGEELLKRLKDTVKNGISWCLKTILTVFTTYMSITGVVSGTTDAAALKAAKVTISSFVPVVGGILSDASEAVLVGAGVMKNAAGIYGIFAVLSLCIGPFLKIGMQYLCLKGAGMACSILGTGRTASLVEDFSSAMGILLGITGAMGLLLLIGTVCFLKGVQ